jgi:predicted kinase
MLWKKLETMNFDRVVIILRAIPGAGKSSFADYVKSEYPPSDATICCADDYHMVNGEYVWKAENIHKAHDWCQQKFRSALAAGRRLVIVANTNTREQDVLVYKRMAEEFRYTVFVVTVENWHGGNDVHNVPDEVKDNMRKQLMNSLKL